MFLSCSRNTSSKASLQPVSRANQQAKEQLTNVSIIGCGNIAKVHSSVLTGIDGVRVTGFVDPIRTRAEALAAEYGSPESGVYASLEELFSDRTIDAVHLCTPHNLHPEQAIAALDHGCHVFMEKPPAIDLDEFERLRNRAAQSNRRVAVCFQNRYNDGFRRALDLVQRGDLGSIVGSRGIVTWNRERRYYAGSDWKGTWAREGGGVLINQAIHTLDLMTQLMGKPIEAEASFMNHRLKSVIEVEDTIEAYVRFEKGDAVFYATNAYRDDSPPFIEVVCTKGKLRLEGNQLETFAGDGRSTVYDPPSEAIGGKAYWGDSHPRCIRDFYDGIRNGSSNRVGLDSVADSFRLALGLYQSAREHRVIRFSE